jgi:hypothetical protein
MRASGLPFGGGIYGNRDRGTTPPTDVQSPRYTTTSHWRALHRAAFSLALPGNSPITYRLIESLAAGALCFSPPLDRVLWLSGGLRAGEHYVALRDDVEDLTERVAYFTDHREEAARIAGAGHAHYERYFRRAGLTHAPALIADFLAQFGVQPGNSFSARLVDLLSGGRRILQPLKDLDYARRDRKGPDLLEELARRGQ